MSKERKLTRLAWIGQRVFLHAPAGRAVIESLVAGTVFVLFILQPRYAGAIQNEGFMALLSGCVMICALHMRLSQGPWWRQILYEGMVALALGIPLAGLAGFYGLNLTNGLPLPPLDSGTSIPRSEILAGTAAVTLLGTLTLFSIYRVSVRLWVGLHHRRRRQLRWALTTAHLVVIAGLSLLTTSPLLWLGWQSLATLRMQNGQIAPLYLQILFGIPPVITYLVVLTFVLAVLLPPFALFSQIVTRGITRRLEGLVAATAALQAGNYSARIAVQGEDEIAQLQTDFNRMAAQLEHVMGELVAERAKSERLLLNILPSAIADRLKAEQRPIADHFADVTVLFADIVDFTHLSAELPPAALVSWLNEIFSAFDRLADQHGLEKIKTIGDAYMVVAGLPEPRADHVEAMAAMALDMQAELARHRAPNGEPMYMRIGIHNGQVVAGVIGTSKFIYDLWGDTVNTASRMESHGVGGAIQVTATTYERLRHCYRFEERGLVPVKGKGDMLAYLLREARAPGPRNEEPVSA
ncbi:MAG TPA: adenylate/guanylate cyclase domain-containing protein [Chloroflexia bacterium]|nr:adenylate/guanylate cyclase domain-containing protein [Chloroflexia bacterium]